MSRSGHDGERFAPRRPDAWPWAMVLRTEVLMGVRLVLRHRTPRLAGVLGALLLVIAMTRDARADVHPNLQMVTIIVGTIAATAGARLLARGAPLWAAHRVAAPSWLAPVGRSAGAVLVLTPVVWGVSLAITLPHGVELALRSAAVANLHVAAVVVLVAALTPLLGVSSSAVAGLIMVWLGSLLPSTIAALLQRWVVVERPVVLLWNVLPLTWRVERWIERPDVEHLLFIGGWVGVGLALSAWTSLVAYAEGRIGGPAG